MTIPEALEIADKLEQQDCISKTAQALRVLAKAYKELNGNDEPFER